MPLTSAIPPKPLNHWSFISLLADILRLPEETVVLTHLYINTYLYYCPNLASPVDTYHGPHSQHYSPGHFHEEPIDPGHDVTIHHIASFCHPQASHGRQPGSSSSSTSNSESASSAYGVKLATERESDTARDGENDGIKGCEGVAASKKVLPLAKEDNYNKGNIEMKNSHKGILDESDATHGMHALSTRAEESIEASKNRDINLPEENTFRSGLDIYVSCLVLLYCS